MAFIAKKAVNKITKGVFASHLAQFEPMDPLYEETIDARGKKKRVRRQLPPGLSPRDTKILQKVKKRAHRLDKGLNLCGFRVGWTFFIGLIPVLGDIVDALLNHNLIVKKCKQAELPDWLITQMIFNNMVSAGVGLIPFAGDIILGIWKANSRNAHLLEEFLALRGQQSPFGADPSHSIPNAANSAYASTSSQAQPYHLPANKGGQQTPPHIPARPDGSQAPLQPGQQQQQQDGGKSWLDGLPGGRKQNQQSGVLPGPGGR